MQFLKRVELWVLLVLIGAGLAWVFMAGGDDDDDPDSAGPAARVDQSAPLRLHRCVLKRDYGNARLDIELAVRNDSAEKLSMQTPKVKLLTSKGREVPSYFLPFDPIPEVPAKSSQDVQLRYWLETADLEGELKLDVNGNSLPIKSSKPFDLKSMPNGEEKSIPAGTW